MPHTANSFAVCGILELKRYIVQQHESIQLKNRTSLTVGYRFISGMSSLQRWHNARALQNATQQILVTRWKLLRAL